MAFKELEERLDSEIEELRKELKEADGAIVTAARRAGQLSNIEDPDALPNGEHPR